MALPVSISGISTAVAPVGPFKVAAGTYSAAAIATGATEGSGSSLGGSTVALGQSFTNGGSSLVIGSVTISMYRASAETGAVIYAEITETSPSGTALATSNSISDYFAVGGLNVITFTFSTPPTIAASATFGVTIRRSGGSGTSVNVATSASSVYAGGSNWTYNGTTWTAGSLDWMATVNRAVTIASDAYYFFGRDGTTATTLQAYKATAPDTSWTSVATKTGFATGINYLSAYQVDNIIHLIVTDGTTISSNHKYQTFDAVSDTFVTAETINSALNTTNNASVSQYNTCVVVRSTGEVVCHYNAARISNRSQTAYRRRTGVATWAAGVAVSASGVDCTNPIVVLGASGRLHFLWHNATNVQQRHLTSANVLGTAASTGATAVVLDAVTFDDGGTIRHVGLTAASAFRWASADNPTVTNVAITFGTPVRGIDENLIVYALYQNSGDSDLYIKSSSDDGATFGTAVSAFVGTVAAADTNLSKNQTVYLRGSDYVFPYVVNDNGTLKYNEYVVRSVGPTDVTGTLAATEAADTAALTGQVLVSGTLATTEGSDTASLVGAVAWVATLAVTEAADTAALAGAVAWNALLAATEAADTALIAGGIIATGTLAVTEAADTAAITGNVASATVDGSLAVTEAPDTASLAGAVAWNATLAAIEAPDAASLAGSVRWVATLAALEAPDVADIVGGIVATGTLAVTETADTASITGGIIATGALAVTEAKDNALITGGVIVAGTLATIEAADTAAFTGLVFAGVGGVLDATEAKDNAAFTGQVTGIAGVLAATEGADTASVSGSVRWLATLAAIEAPDAALLTGAVINAGTLAATEAPDVAALTGQVRWNAILAATEAPDAASFTGLVLSAVTGTLATVEGPDVAAIFAGSVASGTLAAIEAKDNAALTGSVRWNAILAAIEAPDNAILVGTVVNRGTLAAIEAADVAAFTGQGNVFGILAAIEGADIAYISAAKVNQIKGTIGRQSPVPELIGMDAAVPALIARQRGTPNLIAR